jgi:hypothetical protein
VKRGSIVFLRGWWRIKAEPSADCDGKGYYDGQGRIARHLRHASGFVSEGAARSCARESGILLDDAHPPRREGAKA